MEKKKEGFFRGDFFADLDWKGMEFDEEKWENMINSDDLFTELFPSDYSDNLLPKKDLVKVSFEHIPHEFFGQNEKFLQTNRSMSILIPPSSHQRVRYENECKHILRYLSIPNNGTLTIQVKTTNLSFCHLRIDHLDP